MQQILLFQEILLSGLRPESRNYRFDSVRIVNMLRSHDLLIANADLVLTMDPDRREIPGGWIAITDGFIADLGGPGHELSLIHISEPTRPY